MEPKADGFGFTLSTGRELPAEGCVLGLSPKLKAFEGYDGELNEFGPEPLTPDERREIAAYMAALWAAWAERGR